MIEGSIPIEFSRSVGISGKELTFNRPKKNVVAAPSGGAKRYWAHGQKKTGTTLRSAKFPAVDGELLLLLRVTGRDLSNLEILSTYQFRQVEKYFWKRRGDGGGEE